MERIKKLVFKKRYIMFETFDLSTVIAGKIITSSFSYENMTSTVNSPPPRTGAKAVATKPQRQSSFRSGATFPYNREFPYAKFPYREIPYAPVRFQKWRHFPLQGIFLCKIFLQGNSLCSSPVLEVAPLLPIGSFPMQNFHIGKFPMRLSSFRSGASPVL